MRPLISTSHRTLGFVSATIFLVSTNPNALDKKSAAQSLDQDVVTINRMPEEDLQDRLAALRTLMSDGKLDSLTLHALDKLRSKAEAVATLNHSCDKISINSVPQSSCKEFYLTTLPEFEQEYSTVTGNIYMSRLTLTRSMKDRRSQINACVQGMEAFLNPDFSPTKFANLKVKKISIDPVDETTIDVNWTIVESIDEALFTVLKKRISAWSNACSGVVRNSESKASPKNGWRKGDESEVDWNPYFLSQAKKHFSQSPFEPIGDIVRYRETWRHAVAINGKELISVDNPATNGHISLLVDNGSMAAHRDGPIGLSWIRRNLTGWGPGPKMPWEHEYRGHFRIPESSLSIVSTKILVSKSERKERISVILPMTSSSNQGNDKGEASEPTGTNDGSNQKASLLPWIAGGSVIAGGVIAAILLTGKKNGEPAAPSTNSGNSGNSSSWQTTIEW